MKGIKALTNTEEPSGTQRHRLDKALKHVPSLKEIAYHEAGHVVAFVALEIPFNYVTIVPGEDQYEEYCRGRVDTTMQITWDRKLTELNKKQLVVDLAGPLAVRKRGLRAEVYDEPEVKYALEACKGRLTLKSLPEGVGEARLATLIRRTERLLDQHWDEVNLIAHALLKEKTLSRQRVTKLLEDL